MMGDVPKDKKHVYVQLLSELFCLQQYAYVLLYTAR